MKVYRAETGKLVRILKTIDSLDSLKSELERVTGIPETSQILMTKLGLELKAEIMSEAIRATGTDEYMIFLFNRDILDPSNSNVNRKSSLNENITLEPPVNVSLPKQNSRVRYNISEELGAYANLFQEHHTQGQSFMKTAIFHSEICERLYQEQRVQMRALEVALLNLRKHCWSIVDIHDPFHKFAEKEVYKYENLIQSFPADMEILRRVTIHPEIQLSSSGIIKDKESYALADFISQDKLVALANEGIEAFGQLSREINELNIEVQSIQQGTTDALRKKTFDSEFPKMEKILDRNKAYCDTIGQNAEKLEKGLTRVQGQVSKLMHSKMDFERNIEAIENLVNYQLNEYFPEIKRSDDYIREQVIYFTKCKNVATSTLISNLQQISRLESIIAPIPNKLSRLEQDVRTKAHDYRHLAHVHQMPSAYAMTLVEIVRRKEYTKLLLAKSQQLAEVMAHFRDLEQKRRDRYRLDVKKYAPIKIPALDNSPPMCEITAVNMNDDRLPSFSKEDIQLFLNLIDQMRPAVMSQASLIRSTFSLSTSKVRIQQPSNIDPLSTLQSDLVKLFGEVEGMNTEFESIVERSSLFEKPSTNNASIMSRLRSIGDGRLLSPKNMSSSPQTSRGSRRSRQSFSEDGAATIGTGLLVEKMKQLDTAEEKIKAYETRIKGLENLLQVNFQASKSSTVVATTSKSEISSLRSLTTTDHKELGEEKKLGKGDFQILTNKHIEAVQEMEMLKKRNSELESRYKELTDSHEKVLRENGILEKSVFDLEKSYQFMQSSYSEVLDKNVSLESRLEEQQALYSRSSSELSEVGGKYKELQTERDSLSVRCGELEGMVTELENNNKELELRNTSASTLESKQMEELTRFQQRLQDAESECEKRGVELNSLRNEYDDSKAYFVTEKKKLVENHESQVEQIIQEKEEIIKEHDNNKKNMLQEIEGWKETLEKMNAAREEIQISLDKSRDRVRHVELENSETKKALEETENLVRTVTDITLECTPIIMTHGSSDSKKDDTNTDLSLISTARKISDVAKYLDAELVKTRESLENFMSENSNLGSAIAELRQDLQERTEFSRSLGRGLWNYYHNIRTLMRDLGFALPVKSESQPIIKPSTVDEDKDGRIKSPEPSLSDSYHAEDLGKFFANDYVDDQNWPKDRYETLITLTSKVNLDEVWSVIKKMPADSKALAQKYQKDTKLYKDKYKKVNLDSKDKISFKNFKMGDLALFLPTRNIKNCWSAFNINCPNHYLRFTDKISSQSMNSAYMVARIVEITECVAGSNGANPFDLTMGVKYYLLEVEGWQSTANSYHSRRPSTKSEGVVNSSHLMNPSIQNLRDTNTSSGNQGG